VDVRASRQQDLRHLRMPTDRRPVKWGDLVLRGDKIGKEETQREEAKEMMTQVMVEG